MLTRVAVAAALLCICSWVAIPMIVSFTLQTFAVCAIAGLLGVPEAILSLTVYLALGAIGVPVFAGFAGGVAHLIGPTAGYLWGFFLTALCAGFARHASYWKLFFAMAAGIILCYAAGTAWYLAFYGAGKTAGGILMTCVVPFILPDAVKAALAALVVTRLRDRI